MSSETSPPPAASARQDRPVTLAVAIGAHGVAAEHISGEGQPHRKRKEHRWSQEGEPPSTHHPDEVSVSLGASSVSESLLHRVGGAVEGLLRPAARREPLPLLDVALARSLP